MPNTKSILPSEFRGVALLSGYRGVGKSFLAAQADAPQNICFLDFEQKGEAIDSMLNFGKYISMTSLAAKEQGAEYKPLQMYEIIKREFAAIEKDKYTVVVIDNLQPFEEAALAFAKKFPLAFGVKAENAISGAYGGAWPAVASLISGYMNLLYSKGVKLVIAISHLKAVWGSQGPIPNKYRAKGTERWQELSILTLVLVPGDYPPIPAALVMKEQLGSLIWDEAKQEHIIQRRYPLKVPRATFSELRRYLREPANLVQPRADEVPTEEESNPFSEKLSKEQLGYLKAIAEASGRGGAGGEVEQPVDDLSVTAPPQQKVAQGATKK